MKKILILTDFSENAWNAIAYILAFYKNEPVSYLITHIIPPDGISPMMETLQAYVTGGVLKSNLVINKLAILKKRMLEHTSLKKKQVEAAYLEANFIEGIKTIASKHNVNLIVMGTKGQSLSGYKTIGSHTSAVITKIKYPVMVIPEVATFKLPLNIVFPTDYDFIYKAKVLNTLLKIVDIHQSNLSVLRVANSKLPLSSFQQKNRAYLKDYLKDSSASFHRVNQPELETGIQFFIYSK